MLPEEYIMIIQEYRWDVTVRSFADAFAVGNLGVVVRMFMAKKFVIWPFAPLFVATYLYRQQDLYVLFNKKYFDMLNVGEQYEMGRQL